MEDLCETDQLSRNSKRGPPSCPELGHPHGVGPPWHLGRQASSRQRKSSLQGLRPTVPRTPSELEGSSAEADGTGEHLALWRRRTKNQQERFPWRRVVWGGPRSRRRRKGGGGRYTDGEEEGVGGGTTQPQACALEKREETRVERKLRRHWREGQAGRAQETRGAFPGDSLPLPGPAGDSEFEQRRLPRPRAKRPGPPLAS